jgi:hypothetical protein
MKITQDLRAEVLPWATTNAPRWRDAAKSAEFLQRLYEKAGE